MVIFTLQSHVKPLAQKLLRVGTQYLVAVRVAVYVECYINSHRVRCGGGEG